MALQNQTHNDPVTNTNFSDKYGCLLVRAEETGFVVRCSVVFGNSSNQLSACGLD